MKVFLRDQRHRFQVHLEELMKHPVMPYDLKHLSEKTSSIRIPRDTPGKTDENIIFDYRIFPGHIMSCFGQWHAENRFMQVGDTIVQQVTIPPTKAFSQKIVFGVRIKEMINEPGKIGFSYETLHGHAEKGISTFLLEENNDGLAFTIHTFSAPGNQLAKILGPIFSIPYQSYCTRKALQHVKAQFLI